MTSVGERNSPRPLAVGVWGAESRHLTSNPLTPLFSTLSLEMGTPWPTRERIARQDQTMGDRHHFWRFFQPRPPPSNPVFFAIEASFCFLFFSQRPSTLTCAFLILSLPPHLAFATPSPRPPNSFGCQLIASYCFLCWRILCLR